MKNDVIKFGLFGGSFDPIHNGHLQLALWTKTKLSLNRVIFILAAIPPHKQQTILTSPKHRYRMVELAIKDFADFDISDIEIKRKGVSYTIDTVTYYQQHFHLSKDNLFLIIGADSLVDLPNWRNPDNILYNCHVVVLQRPNVNLDKVSFEIMKQIILLPSPLIDISATEIRDKVKSGKSIAHLVTPSVEKYIYENKLYR